MQGGSARLVVVSVCAFLCTSRSFLSRFARSLFPIVIAFEFRAYTYPFISIYSNSIETACHEFKSYHLQRKWGGVVKHDGSFIQSPNFELGYAVCKVHRKIRHTINSGWQNALITFWACSNLLGICSRSVKQRDGVWFLSFAGCPSELHPYSWGMSGTPRQFVGQWFSTPQFA